MCGRVKMEGDFSQLKVAFNIADDYPAINYAPSWNVAPTDSPAADFCGLNRLT